MDWFTAPTLELKGASDRKPRLAEGEDPTVILQAFQGSKSAPESNIDEVFADVALLRQDFCNAVDKVSKAEGLISVLENAVQELKIEVSCLVAKTKNLTDQAEDTDNTAHRANLRFIGFPKGVVCFMPEVTGAVDLIMSGPGPTVIVLHS
ncbi:hypothetical protein NDU88_002565 [Pleurodeles waltl]|uniref:Uncharacterized protein n=1 Tax=Pleurodeles waltl TaxID=8319 RepID=A0AAV7Q975_PLEWA|nr:hypothetical protein NDU88_002565 [Pleurodeles waltl]